MTYDYSEWTQIKATVKVSDLDRLIAVMSAIDVNLMIEDYSDFNLNGMYGELADEKILRADRTIASVSIFVPSSENAEDVEKRLKDLLSRDGIEATVSSKGVNESDWANTWRQYYKPIHIGNRMVIVPKWEEYEPLPGELVVRMDPGMAFGTGSHETTRSIIGMLEEAVFPGASVLDVGTGSGILAICASKLGAGQCRAYDIDPVAVEVARENALDNECDIECGRSDLLAGVKQDRYDIICANIVADIIIRMLPDIGKYMNAKTRLFVSGIIGGRAGEVIVCAEKNGLTVKNIKEDNDWTAIELGF